MKINCETHSYKAALAAHAGGGYEESTMEAYEAFKAGRGDYDLKYTVVVYDKCECCGAEHEEGTNISYNELMGMRLCEACWASLVWH